MACCDFWKSFKMGCSQMTVEPILFFFSLCNGFYVIIAQQLYIQKVCKVNLNFTAELCDNITQHEEEQEIVQKYVSELQAYSGILQAIPAVIFALFAGPWSDTNGRRLLIIFSCFGYLFNNAIFILNTYFFYELRAEWLLLECLQDCTGGYICFFLACYSYISDITTRQHRTKRLAYLDGLFPVGFFAGMASSGHIKERFGFYGNFGLGMIFAFVAMLWAIFFLKDSRTMRPIENQQEIKEMSGNPMGRHGKTENMRNDVTPAKKRNLVAGIFDFENVKDGFRTVFCTKRDKNRRAFLILLGITFLVEIFCGNVHSSYLLFFRKVFKWGSKDFGMYLAFAGVMGLFTQYVALPFLSETVGMHDTTIGLLGIIGQIIKMVMLPFTPPSLPWLLYLAVVLSFLGRGITTTCRALITKCVGPMEVGKVFSVVGAFQAMVPLFSSPTYGFIYKATVATFPGAFMLFSGSLYLVAAVLLIVVHIWMRKVNLLQDHTKYNAENMERLLAAREVEHDKSTKSKIVVEMVEAGERYKRIDMPDGKNGKESLYPTLSPSSVISD